MVGPRIVRGAAALSICESLLLSLSDRKLLTEDEVLDILNDAAAAHNEAAKEGVDVEFNRATAALIAGIVSSGNSVRRS